MRIGYLLKAFPVVSETFIVNEIRAMERHGVPLTILSLKAAPPGPVHSMVSSLVSPRHVAPSSRLRSWPVLAAEHAGLLVRQPRAYRRAFGREVQRSLSACLRRPTREHRLLLRKRLRRFLWAGWVARQAQRQGITHLHAHYATEPLRVAHLVKRLIGTPYSFTAHAKDLYQAPEGRLRRRLATARFATSCHQHGVERLRRLAPADRRDRVLMVRHGIDLERFRRPGSLSSQATTPPRLLAVGRLTPKKGFEDLVSACALLAGEGLELRCDIVGDGKLRRSLEAHIERSGLKDQIEIHGFVPQEDLPTWHARATLFVAPCKELADGNRDGVPNVVLEAMASGLPIVASAAAGLPEIIDHGVDGWLTPPGDPSGLAAGIRQLLEKPALAETLGRAAARRVAELDFETTNRELADQFARILSARVEGALTRAAEAAWEDRGLSRKARKRLGRKPRRHREVEAAIAAAVRPGLEANAWRPDIQRLAGRRLWDEVVKATRLEALIPLLLGSARGSTARVLDLGSGRGGLSVALGARGLPTTALDLRFRNCGVARLRARRYGLEVPAVNSVGEDLPFADSSFDAVACLEVLEHVARPPAVLREIRRVLKPHGRCAVTVINRWAHFDPHYHLWGINFLPRGLANRYIDWRKRTKVSYRDRQTLDEMHYFSFRDFVRRAERLGFRVEDPAMPAGGWRRLVYRLSRRLSLGFNSVTLVLRRVESNVVPMPAKSPPARSAGASNRLKPTAGAARPSP